MQPTEPTDIAKKLGLELEAARRTLQCTTQRGVQTLLHPYFSCRFQMNDWKLRYRQLQHDVFGDTFLAGTKSNPGNKYAEVFVKKFGWSRVFPMDKKGGAHEALYLLFQRFAVPTKMTVDGSKDQTMGVFKRKVT